ncbi:MAG: RtcB family protein [bacterium]
MNVPARIIASEKLLAGMKGDLCLKQTRDMATLKGAVDHVVALSDAHQGYGFPIGGVAAFSTDDGVISPGGVGYDINCGVRLLATRVPVLELMKRRPELLRAIAAAIPSGVGKGGKGHSPGEIRNVLRMGARWAVKNGLGVPEDLERTEEGGCMENADPSDVSDRAIERGLPQLGTLGSGNHFLEFQRIDKIEDASLAGRFGLSDANATVMIHCGSRGLGHQVAGDFIRIMGDKYGYSGLADRELINAPFKSELGRRYLSAMNCAVNYAFCNRQMIMHMVRVCLQNMFPGSGPCSLVYDVCHNIAKVEEHVVGGCVMKLCVHRKGATRSFGPGRREIPERYRDVGQPVIIPGSMGTASYVLVGTKIAEEKTFGSTAHGAGRVESRTRARERLSGEQIKRDLERNGIEVHAGSWKGLVEEAPEVYKDIDEVVRVCAAAGIGRVVARMRPVAVMKG